MSSADAVALRLLDRALRDDTLLAGWQRVHDNDGGPGVDGVTLPEYGVALLAHILALQQRVRAGSYRPKPLRRIALPRPGKTPRILAVPCVEDRVLQSAVAIVLTPLLDPGFQDFSFGYRPGRSVPLAIERILAARDAGLRCVGEADIQSCFDVIPWDAVHQRLQAALPDDSLLPLIDAWLALPMLDDHGQPIVRSRGVPQGSPLSPLLANLFLDGLDQALADGPWQVVRYADDFVLLAANPEDAEQGLRRAGHWLQSQGMALAPDKTRVVSFEHGFSFLGVRFKGDAISADKPGAEPWVLPRALRPPVATAGASPAIAAAQAEADPQSADDPLWAEGDDAACPPLATPPGAPPALPDSGAAGAPAAPPGPEQEDPSDAARMAAEPVVHVDGSEADAEPTAPDTPPRLRSLYLTEPGCYLHIDGQRYLVGKGDEELASVPADKLDLVIADGQGAISFGALRTLARHDGAFLLTPDAADAPPGLFVPINGRQVQLRARQFQRLTDGPWRLALARALVRAKIANARAVLRRYRRNREQGREDVDQALSRLQAQCPAAPNLDALRGIEGAAARAYFDAIRDLLGPQWGFDSRNRQPPRDPINAMLSYGYTVLFHNVHTLILRRGLDPFVGVLHSLKDGHAALASDLMEPYRALIVDATVLALHTRGLLTPEHCAGEGPGRLPLDVRRRLIRELERKLNAPAGIAPGEPDALAGQGGSTAQAPTPAAAPSRPKDWRRIIARDVDGWANAVLHGPEHFTPWRAR